MPAHMAAWILQGRDSPAGAEFGCWEFAQGSVQRTVNFMRQATSYLDGDPRVLKCALNAQLLVQVSCPGLWALPPSNLTL